jgi:hypothetical protein
MASVDPKPGDSMLAQFGPGPKGLMAAEVRPRRRFEDLSRRTDAASRQFERRLSAT